MHKIMHKIMILFIVVLSAACAPISTSITADCATQPVLLGKIKKMNDTGKQNWGLRTAFNVRNSSHKAFNVAKVISLTSENNFLDELPRLIISPDDKMVVHEVFIRSYHYWVCMAIGAAGACEGEQDSRLEINGGIYRVDKAAKNDAGE